MWALTYHGPEHEAWAEVPLRPGHRVLVSCIGARGTCRLCREGHYGQCLGGGWIVGHTICGPEAERVRVPFADTSVHRDPDGSAGEDVPVLAGTSAHRDLHGSGDEDLMLADIPPTGYEVSVLAGGLRPGNVVPGVGRQQAHHPPLRLGRIRKGLRRLRATDNRALKAVLR
jgi:threonine dehydrogenase-like Zn-dependent dehydrogenase